MREVSVKHWAVAPWSSSPVPSEVQVRLCGAIPLTPSAQSKCPRSTIFWAGSWSPGGIPDFSLWDGPWQPEAAGFRIPGCQAGQGILRPPGQPHGPCGPTVPNCFCLRHQGMSNVAKRKRKKIRAKSFLSPASSTNRRWSYQSPPWQHQLLLPEGQPGPSSVQDWRASSNISGGHQLQSLGVGDRAVLATHAPETWVAPPWPGDRKYWGPDPAAPVSPSLRAAPSNYWAAS